MGNERDIPLDPYAARTFPDFVRATAACYGDDIAITRGDETATFAELDARSSELARGLIARGAGKGTRVGFIYGNSPDFAVTLAAITRIGAVAIPLSTLLKAGELVRVLRQSDVHGLIVQRSLLGHDYIERLCDALPELRESASPDLRLLATPFLRWIATSGEGLPPAILPIDSLTAAAGTVSAELLRQLESEVHPADQMLEIYTSGSMALPKGVKHLHGPVLARNSYVSRMASRQRGQEVPGWLPMFWVGGIGLILMSSWVAGAATICPEGTSTNSRMAMGVVLTEEDAARMSQARPWWGLGMTETFGPYSYGDEFRAPGYPLCAPIDHLADDFELRVADADDRPVGDGEIGEIQVRGYPVTPALHKMERGDSFTADGFYHTGDLGRVEGKRVLFVGRDGDMIKTASANVSPAEVEMEMQQFDGIESTYVVGLPDKERGQIVVAAVIPADGSELDFTDIERQLRERLSGYKVPRAYVPIARDQLPMLHSNKVARRQLAAMLAERLGREPA